MSDSQSPNQPADPQGRRPWSDPAAAPPPFPQQSAAPAPGAWQQTPPAFDTPPPFPQAPTNQAPWAQTPSGYAPLAGRAPQGRTSADERMWAMLAHLSSVIAWIVSAGWLNIAGPLIVWFLQKDRSPFVRNAAAGAFNFTLTMWVVGVLGWVFTLTIVGAIIGIPMIIISGIGSVVLGVIGALKAWNGEAYTYPWQVRILS